jgi:hypothetical protein
MCTLSSINCVSSVFFSCLVFVDVHLLCRKYDFRYISTAVQLIARHSVRNYISLYFLKYSVYEYKQIESCRSQSLHFKLYTKSVYDADLLL